MKVVIMQPYLFPYLGYWQMIALADVFVLFDDVNFIKKGWINRNNILLNNSAHLFTLPLQHASQNKLINQININDNIKEKQKLLKMFESAYKKAPFFSEVFPIISSIVMYDQPNLARFLMNQFNILFTYMGIKSRLVYSSEIHKDNSLRAQDKIIDICHRLNATHYINAIGGLNLYSRERFNDENIVLNFIKMGDVSYKQFNDQFIPFLSIIDVMMFNDKCEIKEMLNKYDLL